MKKNIISLFSLVLSSSLIVSQVSYVYASGEYTMLPVQSTFQSLGGSSNGIPSSIKKAFRIASKDGFADFKTYISEFERLRFGKVESDYVLASETIYDVWVNSGGSFSCSILSPFEVQDNFLGCSEGCDYATSNSIKALDLLRKKAKHNGDKAEIKEIIDKFKAVFQK